MMRWALIGCATFLIACEAEDQPIPQAAPTGSVLIELRDALTGENITEAMITLRAENEVHIAQLGADEWFSMSGVPAGSVFHLNVVSEGYATMQVPILIDDEAGDSPQSNSLTNSFISLYPTIADVTVEVADATTGKPIAGATVYAHEDAYGTPWILDHYQGTTGTSGKVLFSGIPAGVALAYFVTPPEDFQTGMAIFSAGGTDEHVLVSLYPSGSDLQFDEQTCCEPDDPCGWANDGACDCFGDVEWDWEDCDG